MKENYKEHQAAMRKMKKMAYKVEADQQWNPLSKYPPNSPCPCKSGKKFKKCHKSFMPMAIPSKEAIQTAAAANDIS